MLKSCSEISLDSKEQLFGTSPRVNFWILIEYCSEWDENVLKSIDISHEVKLKLSELLLSNDYTRLQWIKNNEQRNEKLSFYLIESTESSKSVYKKTLTGYEDILRLNLNNIVTNSNRSETPLILVCTHNSYDACCGKLGNEVFQYIFAESGFEVWQTTHLGGHRFAANILFLPNGIYYGRVDKSDFEILKSDFMKNRMTINNLRGRSFYEKYTQAADYYLRLKIGNVDIHSLHYISSVHSDENIICVNFMILHTGVRYKVIIEELPGILEICPGCNDRYIKPVSQFRLLEIEKTID